MDALSMATSPGPSPVSDSLTIDEHELRPAARIRAALAALSEAYDYALDLDTTPWDFALELSNLRRQNVTNSDLRWLTGRGYVEHGVEVTVTGDAERTFQHASGLTFSRRTCFVLTPSGAVWLRELSRTGGPENMPAKLPAVTDKPAVPPLSIAAPPSPKWDRNRQELRVGSLVLRQFKIPSADEETILAAFEETAWCGHIDDPLPAETAPNPKWRLQQTIDALNRQQRPALIRFSADNASLGVQWEYLREPISES